MKKTLTIAVPTNDRETIAVHTGRSKEFALFTIENGALSKEEFLENHHAHEHGDSCCGRHSENAHKHHHTEILEIVERADVLLYYGMGKGLRDELQEHSIPFEKAKYVYLKEIVDGFLE